MTGWMIWEIQKVPTYGSKGFMFSRGTTESSPGDYGGNILFAEYDDNLESGIPQFHPTTVQASSNPCSVWFDKSSGYLHMMSGDRSPQSGANGRSGIWYSQTHIALARSGVWSESVRITPFINDMDDKPSDSGYPSLGVINGLAICYLFDRFTSNSLQRTDIYRLKGKLVRNSNRTIVDDGAGFAPPLKIDKTVVNGDAVVFYPIATGGLDWRDVAPTSLVDIAGNVKPRRDLKQISSTFYLVPAWDSGGYFDFVDGANNTLLLDEVTMDYATQLSEGVGVTFNCNFISTTDSSRYIVTLLGRTLGETGKAILQVGHSTSSGGVIRVAAFVDKDDSSTLIDVADGAYTGSFHNYTAWIDIAAQQLSFYIDGVIVGSPTALPSSVWDHSDQFKLLLGATPTNLVSTGYFKTPTCQVRDAVGVYNNKESLLNAAEGLTKLL